MTIFDKKYNKYYNNGLKRGWYYHQVSGRCDNCDQGFDESGGVLGSIEGIGDEWGNWSIIILCLNCYNIVCFPTEQNKRWIKPGLYKK